MSFVVVVDKAADHQGGVIRNDTTHAGLGLCKIMEMNGESEIKIITSAATRRVFFTTIELVLPA